MDIFVFVSISFYEKNNAESSICICSAEMCVAQVISFNKQYGGTDIFFKYIFYGNGS